MPVQLPVNRALFAVSRFRFELRTNTTRSTLCCTKDARSHSRARACRQIEFYPSTSARWPLVRPSSSPTSLQRNALTVTLRSSMKLRLYTNVRRRMVALPLLSTSVLEQERGEKVERLYAMRRSGICL